MNAKRLEEIQLRKEEIKGLVNSKDSNLEELLKEVEALNNEEIQLRKKNELEIKLNDNPDLGKIIKNEVKENMENLYDTIEYRKAFMQFVIAGKELPAQYRAASTAADNSAVIPVAVLNKIVEKMEQSGNILQLVNRIAYPAGVSVPTSELASEAAWINDGDTVAVDGKKTASIVFGAFPLVKSIGITFKTQVQSIAAFESAIIENVSKSMVKALERAIVSGDGKNKPKGITTETPAKAITLSKVDYKTLVNIVKAIPAAYKENSVLVMNENLFMDFQTMTDTAGQPIAKTNYGVDGEPVRMLLGRKVVTTDFLNDLDTAKAGEAVCFAYQFENYFVNTSYDMDLQTYIDNPTRNRIYQSYMLVDGKSVDNSGLVLVTKVTA